MYRPLPDYPRASNSPTIIMLVAGLTGVLGFLIGFLTGLGSGGLAAGPAPRVTVTVEAEPLPDAGPTEVGPTEVGPTGAGPTDPAASPPATAGPSPSVPDGTGPVPSNPVASNPAASNPAVPDPAASDPAFPSIRTLVVGVDIQPGTYRTTGPVGGAGQCYWARMNSATGGLGDVIAAGMPTGPATVTILATDKSFQTAGCADWVNT